MTSMSETQSLMEDIDARQNDVLSQLDQLNNRIESLLNQVRPPEPESESLESESLEESAPSVVGMSPAGQSVAADSVAGQIAATDDAAPNPVDPIDPTSQLPAAA